MNICIVGSGIVGLTLAREILNNIDSINIDLFDKNGFPSKGPSLNNSGVLHAGLYYPKNSLKSELCIKGSELLKEYVRKYDLTYKNCGKILVALNSKDESNLMKIYNNAQDNKVSTFIIDYGDAKKIQKEIVKKDIYLHSPNTSIFSSKEIMNNLVKELKEKKVKFLNKKIIKIDGEDGFVFTNFQEKYKYDFIFNVSGPSALQLFESDINKKSQYILLPFIGQYGEISNKIKLNTNIYPVPNPELPFLGIHLTPRFNNQKSIVGPNAFPYLFNDLDKKEFDDLYFLFQRLGLNLMLFINNKNNYRDHAFKEITINLRRKFLNSSNVFLNKNYHLKIEDLSMNLKLSGLRPQLLRRSDQKFVNDFLYYKTNKVIHLINAVSPAFTSSFALAKYLYKYLKNN